MKNIMDSRWQCQFTNAPKEITVGQKLTLLCNGSKKTLFKQPLQIRFLDKEQLYSLHILKTLKQEDNHLLLEVTSYRTGLFQSPFFISDGEKEVLVEGLSFSVQSLLKGEKQPVQPQGPFGPFKSPLPVWYRASASFSFLFLISLLLLLLYRWFQRKTFLQKVAERKSYLSASKSFISGLRKQTEDSPQYLQKMEELFKVFLEDCFLIPALGKSTKEFMKHFKRQYHSIYIKEGRSLERILKEFSILKNKSPDRQSLLKLKSLCQEKVFLWDEQRGFK